MERSVKKPLAVAGLGKNFGEKLWLSGIFYGLISDVKNGLPFLF